MKIVLYAEQVAAGQHEWNDVWTTFHFYLSWRRAEVLAYPPEMWQVSYINNG